MIGPRPASETPRPVPAGPAAELGGGFDGAWPDTAAGLLASPAHSEPVATLPEFVV